MKTNIIKCIAILMLLCLLPTRMWADESFEGSFAWDLTTDSYVNDPAPTKYDVYWNHDVATMNLHSDSGNPAANTKLGGTYTKFLASTKLTITPHNQKAITSVVFTFTQQNHVSNFLNSTWNNATAKGLSNTPQAEVTPTNTSDPISVTFDDPVYVTKVTVYYSPTSYTRTGLNPGDYATMCLPFGSSSFSGAEFYDIAGVTKSGDEITGIALESVSVLEAGKPYIFKATDTRQVINLSGSCQETPVAATGLVGNLSETPIVVNSTNNAYIIGTDNLLHLITGTATANIKQYRAYIKLDDVPATSGETPARLGIFDASAIHNITNDADQQQEVFDLQGRKLTTPQQGLYVIDGKKVIINK